MQFTTILAVLAGASFTVAFPAVFERQTLICSGLTTTPQCCATDVLGVADLDCATPPDVPTDVADFTAICAAIGQEARCCLLPILDQALICSDPI